MMFFERIQRQILNGMKKNVDLFVLWILYIAIQPLISVEHILARADLIPWLMFCLSGTILLRGKRYGEGPHISLTQKKSTFGWVMRKTVVVFVPLLLTFWYDVGLHVVSFTPVKSVSHLVMPVGLTLIGASLLALSSEHERTAWNPPGISSWLVWGLGGILVLGSAIGIGILKRKGIVTDAAPFLLGLAFLMAGSVQGRVQNLRQRVAAGTKDGGSYIPSIFGFVFASVGSAFGLWALFVVQDLLGLGGGTGFEQAFVPAAFVVAWAGVVWPKPTPIAVTCILHEIMPSGGGDRAISTTATPFYEPPEGALRIDPLRVKRVRSMHPWLVHVKASRVPEFDDPIRPLWAYRQPPQSFHILGNAVFEPDPVTNQEQWNEITIHLKGSEGVTSVSGSVTKKLVVLKPFLKPKLLGRFRKNEMTTFRWEEAVPEGTVQRVDATTERLSIEDGSIIVFATEGVAKAFEVEFGAPVYSFVEAARFRPPQIEDYVKV
ncbi:MAG: hypothetical protein CL916_12270 [Deltaproteobacteria bacterium]|nr:hypothetical protein [Deltaproteobacteria bacterium]